MHNAAARWLPFDQTDAHWAPAQAQAAWLMSAGLGPLVGLQGRTGCGGRQRCVAPTTTCVRSNRSPLQPLVEGCRGGQGDRNEKIHKFVCRPVLHLRHVVNTAKFLASSVGQTEAEVSGMVTHPPV